MKREHSRSAGFTLVEIMIVVAIIGVLASVAVPGFLRSMNEARRSACVANLRAIEGAKITWAFESRKATTEVPTDADLFGVDRPIRDKPSCPAGGVYELKAVNARPACTIADHTY